jgi:hypothetical protein
MYVSMTISRVIPKGARNRRRNTSPALSLSVVGPLITVQVWLGEVGRLPPRALTQSRHRTPVTLARAAAVLIRGRQYSTQGRMNPCSPTYNRAGSFR